MRSNRKNKKLNNAGFSLVELLIAVTILAIIVIPILKLFVTSARFNYRARNSLRSTTIAQDIMEGLRAYNINEIQDQFKYPTALSALPTGTPDTSAEPEPTSEFGVISTGFKLVDYDMVGDVGIVDGGSCEKYSDFSDIGSFKNKEGKNIGVYYFYLKDIEMQDTGAKYDALIKVDGTRYMEVSSKDASGNTIIVPASTDMHKNEKNNLVLAYNNVNYELLTGVDKKKDASFEQSPMLNYEVITKYISSIVGADDATQTDKDKFNDEILYFADLKAKDTSIKEINREIKLILENNPAFDGTEDNEILSSVSVKYSIVKQDGTEEDYWEVGSSMAPNPCGEMSKEGTFFLFYYPSFEYKMNSLEFDFDHIIIENNSNYQPSLYAVQQVDTKTTLSPRLSNGEADEAAIRRNVESNQVNYMFCDMSSGGNRNFIIERTGAKQVDLYTNISFSVLPSYRETANGKLPTDNDDTFIGWPHCIQGFSNVYDLMRHLKVSWDGSATGDEYDITEIIYDVEVTVYKEGAMDKGFLNEDIVSSVTGSMTN